MIIFLIGPRCSGKTTVGEKLAARLNASFADTDELVCAAARSCISDIVKEEGWEGFRARESKALLQSSRENAVVATGGGAILSTANRQLMRAAGMTIYLKAPADVLQARFKELPEKSSYPSLSGMDPMLEMQEVLNQRAPLYEACADMIVDACKAPSAILDDIFAIISQK